MKTRLILAGLAITMVLCAVVFISIPSIGTPSPEMIAEKIATPPEQYFVITDPDPILLQAISNVGKSVKFNSVDETKIDELTYQFQTPNLQYQNSFYRVGIIIGDPSEIYSQLFWVSFIGFVSSAMTLVIVGIIMGVRYTKGEK